MKRPIVRPWNPEDDRDLMKMASAGERPLNMALSLGRSEGSVVKRLEILKALEAKEGPTADEPRD